MQQLTFCLLLILLSACSSNKQAGAVYQTRFDFSQVKSYSMHNRNSDFVVLQSIDYVTRNSIEIAIEQSMEKQGFLYSNLDEADVIVSYHLISKKRKSLSQYNKSVLYCSYCLRASNWQSETKNWDSTAVNLIIDLIDVQTQRSVWRSVYPINIYIQDNSRQMNNKIKSAISLMLALYP
jgi:hypothetical protein